jgi:hypothetical protein
MADKDESDLVMVSNESGTDSNPRKWQGTLLSFFTNPLYTFWWNFDFFIPELWDFIHQIVGDFSYVAL